MKEVNYNETVTIPILQKKFQELINSNLYLEVNLMIEQAKNKDLQIKIEELERKLNSVSKRKKKEESLGDDTY
jgi:uncharacterized protein YlxW (UPF0749 family)